MPRGELRKIAKTVGSDPDLALELWDTGNLDAQFLTCLMVKPKQLTESQLDGMVRTISFVQVADWFTSYVVKPHPASEALRLQWMDEEHPMVRRVGWGLTFDRVTRRIEVLDPSGLLDRLERELPTAPPEAQWTMNFVLAGIGIHDPANRDRAIAIGETLGLYEDYPVSKGCTSPYAPVWIREMVRRQE